jgi:RNA polymerase sigma factor for flagellar operon FliA
VAAYAEFEFDEIKIETPAERNDLVIQHLPLVRAIAAQVCRKLPDHVDLDDLIQAGTLGLLDAAERFDAQQAASFRTYATHRIRGAILDSLREADWASRQTRQMHRRVAEVTQELTAQLQRMPTESEIAEQMGMPLERWRRRMLDLSVELIPAASPFDDHEDPVVRDFPDKAENQPESLCARGQFRHALGKALETLSQREREMLALYYDDEFSMSEISRRFGVHQSRTSQIHKTAVHKIARALKSAGFTSRQALAEF